MNMATHKEIPMNATTKNRREDARWLLSYGRNGRRRIETLGWKRLAAIYESSAPGSAVRKAINAEFRRCGYTPKTILALNSR